jgi:hypothetical protein
MPSRYEVSVASSLDLDVVLGLGLEDEVAPKTLGKDRRSVLIKSAGEIVYLDGCLGMGLRLGHVWDAVDELLALSQVLAILELGFCSMTLRDFFAGGPAVLGSNGRRELVLDLSSWPLPWECKSVARAVVGGWEGPAVRAGTGLWPLGASFPGTPVMDILAGFRATAVSLEG